MKENEIEKKKSKKGKTLGVLAAGAVIGAGLGVLFAPKSGKETREDLSIAMKKMMEKAKTLTSKESQEAIAKKIKKLEKEIKDLDKEKVLKIAKKKAEDVKKKAEELVELAKEKGNEALMAAAKEVREHALNVAKSVVAKLEEK